ncbi:MAG: neutral zinc metallopeptidase [Acidimicrobiales bacterium]
MSDTPPGPGWWQASDLRWYPPEQKPGYTPDFSPEAAPTLPPPETLAPGQPAANWWMASDGNWYPPEQNPSAAATTTPPAATIPEPLVPLQPGQPAADWWMASDARWYPPSPQASQPVIASYGQPTAPAPTGFPTQATPQAQIPVKPSGKGVTIAAAVVGALVVLAGIGFVVTRGGDSTDVEVASPTPTTVADDQSDTPATTNPAADEPEEFDEGVMGGEEMIDTTVPPPPTTEAFDEQFPGPSEPVPLVGSDGEPWNVASAQALGNIEDFWLRIMPEVHGFEYEPVSGGFFATSPNDPIPPCASGTSDVENNAYYCGFEDVVAWDDTSLFPDIYDKAGDLGIGVILAHEIGHAIQGRVGNTGLTVTLENQADCYAGAWVASVAQNPNDRFNVTSSDLDLALTQFVLISDAPGTSALDVSAHGNAFDRINGFRDGLENGAASCATYTDQTVVITQIEFGDQADFDSGGNLPFATAEVGDDLFDLMPVDIELFWESAFEASFGQRFDPIDGSVVPFVEGEPLTCNGNPVDLLAYYCGTDDFIGIETTSAVRELYERYGDFGPGVIIAAQYGFAVEARRGVIDDRLLNSLQADCYAGAWTASILLTSDRPFDTDPDDGIIDGRVLSISPGDLAEAVQTLLILGDSSEDDNSRGTGFERVEAFQFGVLDGVLGCSRYEG